MAKLPEGFSVVDDSTQLPTGFSVVEQGAELPEGFSEVVRDDPSLGQIGAGLAAEVAIGEGTKLAGTAAGTAIGAALGSRVGMASQGAALGAKASYVLSSLGGGAAGSIAAQKIEGRDDISLGRVVADSLINLIPASKAAKGSGLAARAGSAALRQGAAGAVIAPAAQVIESAIEGEDITTEQLLATSGLGAALGGTLGISGEAASSLYKRLTKATPEQIENAIFSGDKDTINLLDKVMEGIDIPEGTARQEVSQLAKIKARFFPSSAVGAEVVEIGKEARDRIARGSQTSRIATKALDKIKTSLPEEARDVYEEGIHQYMLKGDDSILRNSGLNEKDLTKTLDFAGELRDEISMLQQKLLSGHYNRTRPLPDHLVKRIEMQQRDGGYLSRRYKMFDDVNYAPSTKQTEDAISELISAGRTITDNRKFIDVTTKNGKTIKVRNPKYGQQIKGEAMDRTEAEAYLQSLMDKRKDPDAVHQFLIGGNTPKGVLKRKKNLDDMPALRSFLGEEHSPIKRSGATIDALSRITAYDEADRRIKDALAQLGLLTSGGVNPNTTQLKLKSGIVREGDEALRVPKDVAIALDQTYNVGNRDASTNPVANFMRNLFSSGIALSKASKVLANPPSYMVNVFGMLANLGGMGMNPFRGATAGVKAGLRNFDAIAMRSGRKSRDQHKRLIELDMVPPGATISDINNGLDGLSGRLAQKALDVPGKLYSLSDTAGRVVAYENHRNLFEKAIPDLDSKELEELAAYHTNRVYQNYNYVPQTLKELNKYGVLGQFAAFTQELMRNQYNQGRAIKDMISGKMAKDLQSRYGKTVDARVLRREGIKRAAALTAMYGGVAALINQFNRQTVSAEEEEAYRRTEAAPWDKDRSLVMWKDGGKINTINASYLIPHMQLWGAVESGMRGDDFEQAMLNGASSLWSDLGGEGDFIYNALVPAVQGERLGSEKPISEKAPGVGEKLDRVGFFFKEAFRPGFSREIERATDAERGQSPKTTALRQLGVRINQRDIGDGAFFKLRDAKERMKFSKSEFNKEQRKFNDTSKYDLHNANYRENFSIMVNAAKDLKTLGLNEDEIITKLRSSGMSTLEALNAIDGNIMNLPLADTNPAQTAWDAIEDLPRNERLKAIRNTENREIRESLMRRHTTDVKYSNRGYSAREVALRGMDNGQKVRYIKSQPNPEAYARDLLRKGIISSEVFRRVVQ